MNSFVFDIGNTAVKYGYFDGEALQEYGKLLSVNELDNILTRLPAEHALVTSVAEPTGTWADILRKQLAGLVLEFAPATTALPLANAYATPETLGGDRLAAAVGAAWLRPEQSTVIVDAGTALKCDFVEGGHTFRGGSIAPGLQMRFRALNAFTGRLPLVEMPADVEAPVALTGTDTVSAIRSGVLNGAAVEVNGLIDNYRRQNPGLGVVLTGGDAAFFQPRLKGPIFAVPELVLIGLHRILVHNVEI